MWIFDWIIAEEQNKTTESSILESVDALWDSEWAITITSEDIPDSAISFFEEPKITQEESEPTIFSWDEIRDIKTEDTQMSTVSWDIEFWKVDNPDIIKTSILDNPNEVLVNAIKSLEWFLITHKNSIGEKMASIESKQQEIDRLKEEIETLNEESGRIAEEKTKVEKMIELFKSQQI